VALTIEAVGEALLFASKAGAIRRWWQALMGGFASSRIRSACRAHGEAQFRTGLSYRTAPEGSQPALEGARALGISLPSTALAQQLIQFLHRPWRQGVDHSGMVRALR
jgi:2-hydroxy-3-oxopropionate reductase